MMIEIFPTNSTHEEKLFVATSSAVKPLDSQVTLDQTKWSRFIAMQSGVNVLLMVELTLWWS